MFTMLATLKWSQIVKTGTIELNSKPGVFIRKAVILKQVHHDEVFRILKVVISPILAIFGQVSSVCAVDAVHMTDTVITR